MSKRVLALALIAALGLVAAACGGGDDEDGDVVGDGTPVSEVTVNLTNWAMEPSSSTLAAGMVKFTATHMEEHGAMDASEGGATHQLWVARLPQGAKAGQSKFESQVVNLTDIKPGESKTAEAELAPGTYELACLVVEQVGGKTVNHYEKGMYTQVTVR